MLWERLFGLYRDADDGAGSGGDAVSETADESGDAGSDDRPKEEDAAEKVYTAEEFEQKFRRRLERERKKLREEFEAEREKAQMTEAERLAAEKQEAEKKAADAVARAHATLITAEAKSAAAAAGVKPERLDYAVKLADLSQVEVDEDGNVDTQAIAAAIKQVLNDLPELLGGPQDTKGGSEFTSTNPGDKPLSWEYIASMPDDERARRWPEIERFARNNPKKS